MLIQNMNQARRQTKLFHSLMHRTLDGLLILASFHRGIKNMVHTAIRKSHCLWLRCQPNNRPRSLERKPMNSKLPLKRHKVGPRTTIPQLKFQTVTCQRPTIIQTLMAMTSLVHSEIREVVVHATQCPSHKFLSQDLSSNMERKYQSYHLNT